MLVEFHPDAETEFIESALFYESRVVGLGHRFILEVEYHIELLLNHPEIGERNEGEFRHLVLDRFPYTLIYTIKADCISIVAVSHQHQRPGYWRIRHSDV